MKVGLACVLDKTRFFCLVESQMVTFHCKEAGDWNRVCCHHLIYFIGCNIASLLAEIFLILSHKETVLAQLMTSSVAKFG